MFLAILMGGKYLLYIINEIVNMVGDLIYTFKYRKIITLIWTIILDGETWRFITSLIFIF